MNKKAMSGQMVNIIRVIVVIVLVSIPLIMFMTQVSDTAGRAASAEVCRDSIILSAKTRDGAEIFRGGALSINCPVEDITIKRKDVSKGSDISWDKLNGILAKELYFAYTKTAGGEYNPFKDLGGGGSICFVSSRLDVEEIYGESISGLSLYLAVKRVPGEKLSLYEAMTGKVADADVLGQLRTIAESGQDVYEFNEPQLVLWRLSNPSIDYSDVGDYTVSTGLDAEIFKNAGFKKGLSVKRSAGDGFSYSEYIIVPESSLSMTTGDVLGSDGFGTDLPFCEHIIYMRAGE